MCSRFDTIPACDRQTDRRTDGVAVASTALAMRALRRARCNEVSEGAGRCWCRFCVVLVRPAVVSRAILPRGLRVVDALRRVELDSQFPRGDVLCFTQFADKHWTLTVDCVALDQVSSLYLDKWSK